MTVGLVEETPERWRIEPHGAMRVPGIVFASKTLLPEVAADRSSEQVAACERAHLARRVARPRPLGVVKA